jgi:hypothetical protein
VHQVGHYPESFVTGLGRYFIKVKYKWFGKVKPFVNNICTEWGWGYHRHELGLIVR